MRSCHMLTAIDMCAGLRIVPCLKLSLFEMLSRVDSTFKSSYQSSMLSSTPS